MVVADINSDGRPDLVVTSTGGIKVFVGTGNGAYEPPVTVADSASVRALAIGDFDRDGRPDIAMVSYDGNDVLILPGDGSGRFGPARRLGLADAIDVVVGDLNKDGHPDLLVLRSFNRVSVHLGDGAGGFGLAMMLQVGPFNSGAITFLGVADADGDGHADVVAGGEVVGNGFVWVLRGDGRGGFGPPIASSAGYGSISALAAGDFDRDGRPDLAVTNFLGGDGTISVLRGNGTGTFSVEATYLAGPYPSSIAVADFNGDGKLDLAAAGNGSGAGVIYGDGTGHFVSGPVFPSTASAVAVLDADGDGRPDLALCGVALSIVLNAGGGRFATAAEFGGVGRRPSALVSADFDGDGNRDVAVTSYDSNDVSVFLGDGRAGFESVRRFAAGRGPVQLAIGDFTGHGKLDLAVAGQTSQDISILSGDGNGSFSPAGAVALPDRSLAMEPGDFNGDSKLDLAVATPTALLILLGDGAGRFSAAGSATVGTNPMSVAVGDFDHDGRLDVALANFGPYRLPNDHGPLPPGAVTVFFGDGRGDFRGSAQVLSGSPTALTAADINRDGNLDLIVSKGDLAVLFGDGWGHFGPPLVVDLGSTSPIGQVRVGDFDEDGLPDLAVSTSAAEIAVLLGRAGGGFGPPAKFLAAAGSMALGDFNRDGRTDVASAGAFPSVITLLLNTGCANRPPVLFHHPPRSTRRVDRPSGN